ncbi:MAG: hypothetical protein QOJ09_1140 [Actinomycetota bacterium]|nr:hypothetical protein [Actinomycetota bacterium]
MVVALMTAVAPTRPLARRPVRDGHIAAAVAAMSASVAVPYAVMGPNLLLDDWFTLSYRVRDGVLWTGGRGQLAARPGAFVLYGLQYGLVGPHPLALYAIQAAVGAATAVLLFLAGRRLLGRRRAAAVSAVWVLLANHSTTDHWFATLPALVSLTLLLLGVLLLQRAVDEGRAPVAAVAVMCASALCYEVTLAPAAVALLAVPWLLGRRPSLPRLAATEVPVFATAVWMLTHTQHRGGHFTGWFDFGAMVNAHLGWGLVRPQTVGAVVALVGAIGVTVALARPAFPMLRGLPADSTRLVAAGAAVIVLGTLAFARYPIPPLGLGDRANAVASVGTALLWVGLGVLAWRAPRPLALVLTASFVVLLAVGHFQRDVDYARAGDDSVRILAALRATAAERPPGTVVVGPGPVYHHGIVGLIGPIDEAVQTDSGDRSRSARVAESEADFLATPAPLRLDVREVLNRS